MENQDEQGRERTERLLLADPEPTAVTPNGAERALKIMQMGGQVGISGMRSA